MKKKYEKYIQSTTPKLFLFLIFLDRAGLGGQESGQIKKLANFNGQESLLNPCQANRTDQINYHQLYN
jgi:hypothetical protein